MANLDNLQNVPSEPGNTVRDRKTKTDYIIQSVTPVVGGGVLFVFINAVDGRLSTFRGETLDDLGFYTIRRNVEHLTPEDVRAQRLAHLSDVLKGNHDILSKIEQADSSVYRDLLLLIQDADDSTLKEKFFNLANKLTDVSDGTYTASEVSELLAEALGDNKELYSQEHLDQLAEGMVNIFNKNVKRDTLKSPIVPKSVAEQVRGRATRTTREPYGIPNKSGFLRELRKKVFLPKNPQQLPGEFTDPGLSQMMKIPSPMTRTMGIIKKATGANSRGLANTIVKGNTWESLNAIGALVEQDQTGMLNQYRLRYQAISEKAPFAFGRKMYNRRTATQSRFRNRVAPRISRDSLLANPAEMSSAGKRYFAIDHNTLINDILGDKPLMLNGKDVKAGDKAIHDHILKTMNGDRATLISAQRLRKISSMAKVELKDIFSEHAEIHGRLPSGAIENLAAKMGQTSSAYTKNPALEFMLPEGGVTEVERPIPQNAILQALDAEGNKKIFHRDELDAAKAFAGDYGKVEMAEVPEGDIKSILENPRKYLLRNNPKFGRVTTPAAPVAIPINIKPVDSAIKYDMVRKQSRMGFAMLKDATGRPAMQLTGSQYDLDIDTHIKRGLEAARTTGDAAMILDIESSVVDSMRGVSRVTQIGLGYQDADLNFHTQQSFFLGEGGEMDEVQGIADLTGHLRKARRVGTQGSHDFDTLIRRVQTLSESGHLSGNIQYMGNETAVDKALKMIEDELLDARANKGYDEIPLKHIAGTVMGVHGPVSFPLGNASQPRAARDLLGDRTIHAAIEDVAQAFQIRNKLGLDKITYEGMLTPAQVAAKGKIFYADNTRTGMAGAFLKLHGFENTGAGTPGVEAVFQQMVLGDNGQFRAGGGFVSVSGSSANMVGGAMADLKEITENGVTINQSEAAKLLRMSAERADDNLGRVLRGINPLSKSFYDVTDTFNPTVSGVYGPHEIAVMKETRRLMHVRQTSFDRFINSIDKIPAGNLDEAMQTFVRQTMSHAKLPGSEDAQVAFEARLRFNLEEVVRNPVHRQMIKSEKMTGLLESPFGQGLMDYVGSGLGGDSSGLHGTALFAQRALAEAAKDEANYKVWVADSPRISLQAFAESKTLRGKTSVNLMQEMGPGTVEAAAKDLASQTLLEYTMNMNPEVAALVEASYTGDVSKLIAQVGGYARDNEIASNIPNLTNVLQQMHHLDRLDPKYGEIPQALSEIMSAQPFHDVLKNSILARTEKFQKVSHLLGVNDPKVVADRIAAQLHESFAAHGNAAEALSHFVHQSQLADPEGTAAFFTDAEEHSFDALKGLTSLNESTVKQMQRRIHEELKTISDVERGGLPTVSMILEEAQALSAQARFAGMEHADILKRATSFVDESISIARTSEPKNIIADLTEVALRHQKDIAEASRGAMSDQEAAARFATKAMSEATGVAAGEFKDHMAEQHAAHLGQDILALGGKTRVVAPLMAVGGAMALMASFHTPQEDYSGGKQSDQHPGPITSMSEIPGSASPSRMFKGSIEPFVININATAFTASEAQKRIIQQKVHDAITGATSVFSTTSNEVYAQRAMPRKRAYDELRSNI
jgi:hypothetical protein